MTVGPGGPWDQVGPYRALVADTTGSGEAVVLLHGQPGTAADWRAVVPLLAGEFTVLGVDRPGWGRTGGPAGGFVTNAAATLDLLDRGGYERAVLVGHSWGGGVALAVAEAAPERVAGVVLVASVAPSQPVGRLDRWLGGSPVGDLVVPIAFAVAGRFLSSRPAARLGRRLLPDDAREAIEAVLVTRPTAVGAGPRWRAGRAFTVEQRAFLTELDALDPGLGAIDTPVELLYGAADRVVAPGTGAHLAAMLPDAHLRVVAGAGHLLPLERPGEVAASVRAVARRSR